ncbi:TrkH family potassium uptake protein [Symbiobacterium thermophilum]|uniref:Potassium uptake system protein n=1 Tax=Symbiobacterium thermophilum (strain DSM 24528 / JCM 14929 / IAM 14863 / T) TaxID=292459 RepID=Q67QG3_SYMTH|nr:TrkH family potassium uptake protein [Symbiobacterium thermophilum]BAD40080.1 potassium uptake system protein [Symbiobacterium thermophilum IAM 14863]
MALQHRRRGPTFTPPQALAAGFALLILIGTVLLALPVAHEPGHRLSLTDALFMATSAVCVTGLAVVDVSTTFSAFGEVVLLLLVQAGGLGIMSLSALMFLLTGRRIGLHERLMMQEALGSLSIAGVVRLTRTIIAGTLAVEAIGAALLSLRFLAYYPPAQALYFGIFHSITAFNNAGFDLTSRSLRPFQHDPAVLLVMAGLILMGGMGFVVLQDVWHHRRWERFSLQTKLVLAVTGVLVGAATLLVLALEWGNPATLGGLPVPEKLLNAFFTAVTFRTAGFESIPTAGMASAALLLAMVLMFIGGSPGGTGGGIRTTTFAVIALAVRATVRGTEDIQAMGRRLPRELLDRAIAIVAMSMAVIVAVGGLLLVTEGHLVTAPGNPFGAADVLFESTSAFTTMGLSTGVTPHLSMAGRLLLTVTMYVGRIGPLTAAVALAQRRRERVNIDYPEERVMIG